MFLYLETYLKKHIGKVDTSYGRFLLWIACWALFLFLPNYTVASVTEGDTFHPRLVTDSLNLQAINNNLDEEPFVSMVAELKDIAVSDTVLSPGFIYQDPALNRALSNAGLYLLTGDSIYASLALSEASERVYSVHWANPNNYCLHMYNEAVKIALIYDWCYHAQSMHDTLKIAFSQGLKTVGEVIFNNGGIGQVTSSLASYIQGARYAAAGMALLATDETISKEIITDCWEKVESYLSRAYNLDEASSGWNIEGNRKTVYTMGNFVGPFAIAACRSNPKFELRCYQNLEAIYWSVYANFSTAKNIMGLGNGVQTGFYLDYPHTAGEGMYGQAFYFAGPEIIRGFKYWYNRTQGNLSPYVPIWDNKSAGTIWSILYYPGHIKERNPMEIPAWKAYFNDSTGVGVFIFRNDYNDENDMLAQFYAGLEHDESIPTGPENLSFEIIAGGTPFVIGGGFSYPGNVLSQSALYGYNPGIASPVFSTENATLVGSPKIYSDGSGYIIAETDSGHFLTNYHKRWFAASYDKTASGAEAVYIIADESDNGSYFQISTFVGNEIEVDGNTFEIISGNNYSMKGTILYPVFGLNVQTGEKFRSGNYGYVEGDSAITTNKYIHFQGNDGKFVVVLTINPADRSHPDVHFTGELMTGANIMVNDKVFGIKQESIDFNPKADSVVQPNVFLNNSVSLPPVYVKPNPVKGGYFYIGNFKEARERTVSIYNAHGNLVYTQTFSQFENELMIPSALTGAPSLFLVRIDDGYNIITRKVLILN